MTEETSDRVDSPTPGDIPSLYSVPTDTRSGGSNSQHSSADVLPREEIRDPFCVALCLNKGGKWLLLVPIERGGSGNTSCSGIVLEVSGTVPGVGLSRSRTWQKNPWPKNS